MAKKMKKLFAMLLTVCMVMSLLGVAASAEGTDYQCGKNEHVHGETCYTTSLICEKHVHDEACYDAEQNLVCTTPVGQDLICTKNEHAHTVEAGCYHKHTAQKCYPLNCSEQYDCSKQYDCTEQYDCTNSEEGHVHGEGCLAHTHGEGCAHVHGEGCPAHVHVDGCYDTTAAVICGKTEEALEGNLVCTKEVHAHVEDVAAENSCYKLHEHVADCYKTELTCTAEEHTHVAGCAYGLGVVALVGETPYTTLKDAVAAANASEAGGETIKLMDNVTMTEKLTVKKNTTIDGNSYAIVRGDSYKGTFFTVDAGVTLTLDGGLVIDGSNEWTLLLDEYMNALRAAEMIPDNAEKAHNRFVKLEENAPVSDAAVFAVSGNMVLESGTVIQNHALAKGDGKNVFSVAAGGTLTMNGPVLKHNTKIGSQTLMNVSSGGTCVVNNVEITDNFGFGNGCLVSTSGELYVNNIDFHTNYGTSNGMFRVYGGNGYMEVNNGAFYDNYVIADANNNWNGMVYVHNTGATFVMNGGSMQGNYATECGGVSAKQNGTSTIIINGGVIKDNVVYTSRFGPGKDVLLGNPLEIGKNKTVENKEVRLYNDFVNNGTLNANTVYVNGWANIKGGARVYSGEGIVNGDVYLFGGAKTTMESGVWNGLVTVDDVDSVTSLTVKDGATIKGVQVRVLNSLSTPDYTNATEAAAVQAAAYVEEDGAIVESPVLFYHRLAANQKQNIVVTYDYNGGLDASGWSGCQITSASSFVPTAPAPTKEGFVLAGWAYAVDNNPECLTMESGAAYNGEEITQSLRLIAQWTTVGGNGGGGGGTIIIPSNPTTPDVNIDEEDVPLGQLPEEEVEIGEEDVPLTELPEEDVPLAMAPETGDASAIWAVMSALSGAGLFLTRKKREDEE